MDKPKETHSTHSNNNSQFSPYHGGKAPTDQTSRHLTYIIKEGISFHYTPNVALCAHTSRCAVHLFNFCSPTLSSSSVNFFLIVYFQRLGFYEILIRYMQKRKGGILSQKLSLSVTFFHLVQTMLIPVFLSKVFQFSLLFN